MAATIVNMSHTAIMVHEHIDPTFLHMCDRTQPTAISTSHIMPWVACSKYLSQIPHVKICSCAEMSQLYQYIPQMDSLQSRI